MDSRIACAFCVFVFSVSCLDAVPTPTVNPSSTVLPAMTVSPIAKTSEDSATLSEPLSNEQTLFRDLFTKYDKNLRPNYNSTGEPLQVQLGLVIRRIEFLDEKRQTLLFHATTRMRWRDQRLTWNKQDYDQVQDIAFSSYALWIPDIRLANQADGVGAKSFEHVLANIYYDGQILLSTPSAFKVYCGMDFGKWPYDLQNCAIEFESFTQDGTRIDLQMMGNNQSLAVEIDPFASTNEWHVLTVFAHKQIKTYECCPGEYHSIYFVVRLQRNQPFYRPLMLTPMILMIFATWLIYLLPLQSSAKIVVGAMELVFVASFALFLKSYLPPSLDEVPHIVTLNLNAMILIVLALFVQVMLQWLSRLKRTMPATVRSLFLDNLGRFCCVKQPSGYTKSTIQLHVPADGQEGDHFEMSSDGADGLITEKSRHEWFALATVLNRILFIIHMVVCFVVLL